MLVFGFSEQVLMSAELQFRTGKLVAGEEEGGSSKDSYPFGEYLVVYPYLSVTESLSQASETTARLRIGTLVEVLQIEDTSSDGTCDGLSWSMQPVTRARIEEPDGWITIKSCEPLQYFALPRELFGSVAGEAGSDLSEYLDESMSVASFQTASVNGSERVLDLTVALELDSDAQEAAIDELQNLQMQSSVSSVDTFGAAARFDDGRNRGTSVESYSFSGGESMTPPVDSESEGYRW